MAEFLFVGTLLGLIQILAALPWLAALDPGGLRARLRHEDTSLPPAASGVLWLGLFLRSWMRRLVSLQGVLVLAGILVGMNLLLALFYLSNPSPDMMAFWGRLYASLLQLQLSADFFVLFFLVLLKFWPQGGAVSLAAFREGIRQSMFWVILLGAVVVLAVTPFLPYFTFGEDIKVVKVIGFEVIMLAAAGFGVVTASVSMSEEIEGRTAITVMSKPISRRQYLLGKFIGILMAALAMTLLLGCLLLWIVLFKERLDPLQLSTAGDKVPDPPWVRPAVLSLVDNPKTVELLRGVALWVHDLALTGLGLLLGFGLVMAQVAIAVALATRLPMTVNIVICAVVFFLAQLMPVLIEVSRDQPLIQFTANLFHTLLPSLEFNDMSLAIVREDPPPTGAFAKFVGSVKAYNILYTAIALLFGLILFEDRDLA
jgi:ABC-type transport system involved in multi-copper enzyme maturation permease subunit